MKVQLPNPSHLFSEILPDCGDNSSIMRNEADQCPVGGHRGGALQWGRAPTSPAPPPAAVVVCPLAILGQWRRVGRSGGKYVNLM